MTARADEELLPRSGRRLPTILIGDQDTCGYFASLAAGFRALGCRAYFLDVSPAALAGDETQSLPAILRFYRLACHSFNKTRHLSRFSPKRYLITARHLIAYALLLGWMLTFVDTAIFKSGKGYSESGWDMRLLRVLGRRVVSFFVGSDSRPLYLAGVDPMTIDLETIARRVTEAREVVRRAEELSDIVVANPLSAQMHERPICIAQIIGNTLDPAKIARAKSIPRPKRIDRNSVRIVHAPSLETLKGTDRIRAAMEAMAKKGFSIDYVEVSGRPNEEVLALLTTADLVIDELYSDSYGGMLAHEACALGVPVLVCGYGADTLQELIPPGARTPSIFGRPEQFLMLLEKALKDVSYRKSIAAATASYGERTSAKSVAARLLAVIEGRAPDSWYVDPRKLEYVEGVAGPAENVAAIVRAYVARYDVSGLQLEHNPGLRDRLVAFSGSASASPTLDRLSA